MLSCGTIPSLASAGANATKVFHITFHLRIFLKWDLPHTQRGSTPELWPFPSGWKALRTMREMPPRGKRARLPMTPSGAGSRTCWMATSLAAFKPVNTKAAQDR